MAILALSAACSVIAALTAVVVVDRPVSRNRLQRFADRHDLRVTADNGALIVAYLATTRRWRAAGVAGGFVAYTVGDLLQNRIFVNVTYLLAGWFVGALIAEARIAGLLTGRRAASLTPRTADRYLPWFRRWALFWSVLASLVLTGAAALVVEHEGARQATVLGVTLLVALAVWTTTRRVLRRSQPVVPGDLLDADNAIRSRSLHVLTASGITLVLYCALDQGLRVIATESSGLALAVMLVGAVAVPWSGWRLATSWWPVPAAAA